MVSQAGRSVPLHRGGRNQSPSPDCVIFGHLVTALAVVPYRYHTAVFHELARHMTWRVTAQGDAERLLRILRALLPSMEDFTLVRKSA